MLRAWLSTGSEQLTLMSDEQSRPQFNKPSPIPKNVNWQSLVAGWGRAGDALSPVRESLGKQKGMLSGRAIHEEPRCH